MTGLIPENQAMANVNSNGTVTCPGNQRVCMPEFMANVQSGAAAHDGGELEGLDVEARTISKHAGKNGKAGKQTDTYEQALENAAADMRRAWARQRKLVIRAFERQFKKKIEELSPWWDYSFGLTADTNLKEPTLHVIWELEEPEKWPDGKRTPGHHAHFHEDQEEGIKVQPRGSWLQRVFGSR